MEKETQKVIIDISTKTILKIVFVLAGLALLFVIRDVFVLFFVVLVLYAALNPIVDKWEEEIPRNWAVSLLFTIIILFAIAAGLLIIPPIVQQIQELSSRVPDFISNIAPSLKLSSNLLKESQSSLASISSTIAKFGQTIFNTTVGFLSGLVAIITIFVSTYYLMIEKDRTKKFFFGLHLGHKKAYLELFEKISEKMGAWMRGELTLMLIIGAADFVGLLLVGVPYALALGVWAGLTELIPYLGPILGAIPAILVALTLSPLKALIVALIFVFVQQMEAHFIVPKIMSKAIGLSPVIIIFAMLAGAKLMGILGVLIAVPAAAVLSVFIQEYPLLKNTVEM